MANSMQNFESAASSEMSLIEKSSLGALSLSKGIPLVKRGDMPATLSAAFVATAQKFPNSGITYLNADGTTFHQSYRSLYQVALKILSALRQRNLQPQDKVIVQLERTQDFIESFWACILGGFVPVPLATAASSDKADSDAAKALYHSWQIFQHPLILTSTSLTSGLLSIANEWHISDYRVAAIEDLRKADISNTEETPAWHQGSPDDLTLLFLNGRFGPEPKGVQLSHRNIISNIAAHVQQGWLSCEDTYLNWLPVHNPGPLLRSIIWTTYVGAQQIQGEVSQVLDSPLQWLDWIEQYRVSITWAPNFAFGLLNKQAKKIAAGHWDLSSIRYWLNTAEPIVPKTGQTFLKLMVPHGLNPDSLHGVWGMKETAASATDSNQYASDTQIEKDELLADLGLPLPGVSLRIVNEQHELLPERTIGHLQVKGDIVTCGYYQSPQLNKEVFTSDGWYKTGDLGFLSEGRLTLTGRSKALIIVNGKNHYSHEIEQVVAELDGIAPSSVAACGLRQSDSNTDSIVVFFQSLTGTDAKTLGELLQSIEKSIVEKIGVSPAYFVPLVDNAMSRTNEPVLDRRELQQRFEAGEFSDTARQSAQYLAEAKHRYRTLTYEAPQTDIEVKLASLWQTLLKVERIGRQDNFFELGGNSLLATQMISQTRTVFSVEFSLRTMFESPTMGELATAIEALIWLQQDHAAINIQVNEETEVIEI